MTLEDFYKKCFGTYFHNWKAYNGHSENYICKKCNLKAHVAYTGPSCISDEEAIIKNLLE